MSVTKRVIRGAKMTIFVSLNICWGYRPTSGSQHGGTAMRRVAVVLSLVVGTTVAVASPASAVKWTCASTAHVDNVSGPGYMNWYGQEAPTGKKWHGVTMKRDHFYELHHVHVRISYGGATEVLSGNAIVLLSCAGIAAGDPLDVPNIVMLRGTDVVHATHAVPATVSTEEGLFGPVPGSAAMVFQVHRSLTDSQLTLEEAIAWYQGYNNQPTGTSATKTESGLKVNVTPYVGPDPGSCRHVDHATLTTTKTFGHGTAVYDG